MRSIVPLLSAILIAAFLFQGIGEAASCGRYVCTRGGGTEWLGVGDLGMDMEMPDLNTNQAEEIMAVQEDEKAPEEEPDESEEEVAAEKAAERWSLTLSDEVGKDVANEVDLVLVRSGDVVFGVGNLTADNATSPVAASGSAFEGEACLDLVPLDGSDLYRLTLGLDGESISGIYEAYSSEGAAWSGTAEGTLQA